MDMFEDRMRAFECKFQHELELLFKINCVLVRLVGEWAAKHLGISGEEAETYILKLLMADIDKPAHAHAIRMLRADFKAKGLDISRHRIVKAFEKHWEQAREQVMTKGLT